MGQENAERKISIPNLQSKEIIPVFPTFYIFKGISGAGCSTAIDRMVALGLLHLAPPEFTTRPLRPNEKWGDKHHPVSMEQLNSVRYQIAISELQYGNEYGFFLPAINRIRSRLDKGLNIVVDSGEPPSKWHQILGSNYPIVSIFFAPRNPLAAIDRIVSRAKKSNDSKIDEYLLPRAAENSKIVKKAIDFDFWVDTTDLTEVLTNVQAIVEATSYGKTDIGLDQFRYRNNPDRTQELIQAYSDTDSVQYAEQLLGLANI